MKCIYYYISAITIAAFLTACSHSKNNQRQYEAVEAAARRDVAKVVDADEGTMQREHAVLAIKVREHALRSNGHENEADIYMSTARTLLVDSLHIIEDR